MLCVTYMLHDGGRCPRQTVLEVMELILFLEKTNSKMSKQRNNLLKTGKKYYEEKKCLSCEHVSEKPFNYK